MTRVERWRWTIPFVALGIAGCGDEVGSDPRSGSDEPLAVEAFPPGGEFEGALVVRLLADRPARIFYTTDGSLPSTSQSREYTGPMRLTESTLLGFIAVDDGGLRSSLQTEWYSRAEDAPGPIRLPARSLRVRPDRLVFTPEAGIDSETKTIRLEAIGTEPVTVFALSRSPAGATTNQYDPDAFSIVPSTTDPTIRPGEPVELRITYFTTRTSRSMGLTVETDAENVPRGMFPLLFFGRMFP